MSSFYAPNRQRAFARYIGLSFVVHMACIILAWTYLRSHIRIVREAGVEVAIRTIPGMKRPPVPPRPDARPAPDLAARPAPAAPRRKIGRIVEKKYKLDMPKVEPQSALRRTRAEDEVRALNDKNIARIARAENVELIEIERGERYQPPAPAAPTAKAGPKGDYVPSAAAPAAVDVNIDFVEIPFEAGKIDIGAVNWTPALAENKGPVSRSGAATSAAPGEPGKRMALKRVKPELPLNHGIQDPRVEVILRIVIAENGFVSKAEIERSGGYLDLDKRALAAVRQWIYESAPRKETRLVRVEYVF